MEKTPAGVEHNKTDGATKGPRYSHPNAQSSWFVSGATGEAPAIGKAASHPKTVSL